MLTSMNHRGRCVLAAVVVVGALFASGCSSSTSTPQPAPTVTVTVTAAPTTATPTQKSTPPPDTDGDGVPDSRDDFPNDAARSEQLHYQSGDPVPAGYPLVVETAQIDYRVANAIKTPQAVALAPGVYVGYNPAVTDLAVYLESNVGDGDCAVRDLYGFGGGSCWNGVLASPAEPAQ